MFRSYFLIAWRNLRHHKLFSIIHLAGLSIGLAAWMFIFQYVSFEKSYENFHQNRQSVYRVLRHYQQGETEQIFTNNVPALGPAIQKAFPEILEYARLIFPEKFTTSFAFSLHHPREGIKTFNEKHVFYTDQGFLNMFSFPWLAGNRETALQHPNSVVLTKAAADKYFGTTFPIGQQLILNGETAYTVTGLLSHIPANSHLQFDVLCSFNSLPKTWNLDQEWGWGNFHTYIQLRNGSKANILEGNLNQLKSKYLPEEDIGHYPDYILQPIQDIRLHSHYLHELSVNGNARTALEVGIRKVMGAHRTQLIRQSHLRILSCPAAFGF